jgi:hypothetical protein
MDGEQWCVVGADEEQPVGTVGQHVVARHALPVAGELDALQQRGARMRPGTRVEERQRLDGVDARTPAESPLGRGRQRHEVRGARAAGGRRGCSAR